MKSQFKNLTMFGLAGSIMLTACGGGGGSENTDPVIPVYDLIYRADAVTLDTNEVYATSFDGVDHGSLTESSDSPGAVNMKLSPDGNYLAMKATDIADGKFSLYVDDLRDLEPAKIVSREVPDGIGIVSVTDVKSFRWSPDSNYLAYSGEPDNTGRVDLFSVRPDGSDRKTISDLPENDRAVTIFEWAPNSQSIAYVADQDTLVRNELYVASITNGVGQKIHESLDVGEDVNSFQWAPDSSRITYLADQDTNDVMELYTAVPSLSPVIINFKISNALGVGGNVGFYQWSPDSSKIAYLAYQDNMSEVTLYTISPTGGDFTQVSINELANVTSFSWSPDSSALAFRAFSVELASHNLFTVRPDGSEHMLANPPLIANGDVIENAYAWSPDSTMITYRADQEIDTKVELFVTLAFSLSNQKLSEVPGNGDVHGFKWAPDSSRIAFRADAFNELEQTTIELYTVVSDGAELTSINHGVAGGPRTAEAGFKWSPDSQYLAFRASLDDFPGTIDLYTVTATGDNHTKVGGPLIDNAVVKRDFVWIP